MKKLLSLILVITTISTILSACSVKNDTDRQWRVGTHNKDTMYIYYPQWNHQIPSDSHVDDWEDYIEENYNFKVNLTYTPEITDIELWSYAAPGSSTTVRIEENKNVNRLKFLSGSDGFVYVKNYETLNELIRHGLIIPVNGYLQDIPCYSDIGEEIIGNFTSSASQTTWAFPLSNMPSSIFKRTYNKEWLDKAGMPVPENIEEFTDYAKYVKTEDPDGNGFEDTYVMEFKIPSLLSDFSDIFKAFGCYSNSYETIYYNPVKEKYECMLLNTNFIEAMTYILYLYQEGYIKLINTEFPSDITEGDYKTGSAFRTLPKGISQSERAYGYYLKGYNKVKLIELQQRSYCMAVLKHTDNVAEKMNDFLGLIENKPEAHFDLILGIKGVDYFDYGTYYDYLMRSDDMSVIPRIGLATWFRDTYIDAKPLIGSWSEDKLGSYSNISSILESRRATRKADEISAQYLDTPLVYTNPYNTITTDIKGINSMANTMKSAFFQAVFENDVPLLDAYDELVALLEIRGISGLIDSLND